jgi:hypothetical protein
MAAQPQKQLREGVVNWRGRSKNGEWLLFTTREDGRVLAMSAKGTFEVPSVGDRVSVEITKWNDWDIGVHRTMAVDKARPFFDTEGLSSFEPTRNGAVINMILDRLAASPDVTAEDILPLARREYPGADGRFIGSAFQALSKRGVIHRTGYRASTSQANHARPQAVWELTRK